MSVSSLPSALPLGRDSVSYRVALEPALIVTAGPRALLLQVTQPSVAAGVAQHSDYESRPWVRLFRTLELMTQLAFGDPRRSEKAVRRLRRRHAGVTGQREDGVPYRALDPELLVWVWATLGDGMVTAHERFVRRLTDDEREQLYEEWKIVGYACGIPVDACPPTWSDFVVYFEGVVRTQLEPTEVATNVAAQVRRPPLPFPLNRMTGGLLSVLTGGQFPEQLRRDLGFEWSPVHQLLFDASALGSRAAARLVPGRIRRVPMALAISGPNLVRFPIARPSPAAP